MPKAIGIEPEKIKALMRLKPTLEDTAAFFECSASHIEKFVKSEFGLPFSEFRDQNMVHTRFNLIRTALQKAQKGDNVMLIFCLKNLCGWKDKWDNSVDDKSEPIVLSYVPKSLRAIGDK